MLIHNSANMLTLSGAQQELDEPGPELGIEDDEVGRWRGAIPAPFQRPPPAPGVTVSDHRA
jgi:hypothetical protein